MMIIRNDEIRKVGSRDWNELNDYEEVLRTFYEELALCDLEGIRKVADNFAYTLAYLLEGAEFEELDKSEWEEDFDKLWELVKVLSNFTTSLERFEVPVWWIKSTLLDEFEKRDKSEWKEDFDKLWELVKVLSNFTTSLERFEVLVWRIKSKLLDEFEKRDMYLP